MRDVFIVETPNFEIHRIYAFNSLRNYTYLIFEKATHHVTIIDPYDATNCWDYLSKFNLTTINMMNTHQHHDHIRGNQELLARGAKLWTPAYFKTQLLPGHTCEHVVFMLEDESIHLFCGDTLFQAGVGNCKNGGDPIELFKSVQWLKEHLSKDALIHVGHDYFKKNLEFARQFDDSNPEILKFLKLLEQKEGFELPPTDWKTELLMNPYLRLSETSIRQKISAMENEAPDRLQNEQEYFLKLRTLRDVY